MDERAATEAAETASRLSYAGQGLRPVQWSDDQRRTFEANLRELNQASTQLAQAFADAYLAAGAQLAKELDKMVRQTA